MPAKKKFILKGETELIVWERGADRIDKYKTKAHDFSWKDKEGKGTGSMTYPCSDPKSINLILTQYRVGPDCIDCIDALFEEEKSTYDSALFYLQNFLSKLEVDRRGITHKINAVKVEIWRAQKERESYDE